MDRIKSLILYVTNKCSLYCEHCFYHAALKKPKQELSLGEIERFVKQIRPLGVSLCGGEPTLRNDLPEICHILQRNGVKRIGILSNGFSPEKVYNTIKKILEEIDDVTITLHISIDGLKKTHDEIRKSTQSSFDRLVETVEMVKPLRRYRNFDMCLRTIIMSKNFDELERLTEFVDTNLKISHYFELVRGAYTCGVPKEYLNFSYSPQDQGLFLNEENMKKLEKVLYKIFMRRGMKGPFEFVRQATQFNLLLHHMQTLRDRKACVRCDVGKIAILYPEGTLGVCEFMKLVGNLKEENLDFNGVFNGKEAEKQKIIADNCYCTHGCFISGNILDAHILGPKNRIKSSVKLMSYGLRG